MPHLNIVVQQYNLQPPDSTTSQGILAFVLRVIAALPPEEGAGLLRKDAGENITFYPPAQCNVSISRICYPDGHIYKILTDAGVGGANGPSFNDDGFVEVNRYIRIIENHPGPDPQPEPQPQPDPVPVPTPVCKFVPCECKPCDLSMIEQKLDTLLERVDALDKKSVTFPAYVGKLGLNIRLTPESK